MGCFACGHVLYNWAPQNAPLEEHRLLLPECTFAKLQKNSPELIEELWDADCLQSVSDVGYSTEKAARGYFKLLHKAEKKKNK